ncbi:DNA mismatch repair endonuclease MutL [Pseudothermotoga sp. U03pept]|uniref:DNA mismatch repair endonuclease MutL n=1 Tax=Pseudothermotoga sp. U03pept TaxID=3447012 RepID=UPI003F078E84
MKIKKLDPSVVSRIAAGEVVVGTHSVVKELVENSIDAGAKKIVVELLNGGKSEIKVQDNGDGMDKEDLLNCFQPHTTSKISSFEDIYQLTSFGFRGEALYSVCQVSKTRIISRPEESSVGHEIEVVAGNLAYERPTVCQKGTTVIVKDLFFNVPARRKFLKSAAVEARMATEAFERFCLSHPQIHFVLVRDQEVVYNLMPSDLPERTTTLFKDLPKNSLKYIEMSWNDMKIDACLTLPTFFRKRRSIYTYVNGRYVVNNLLSSAIYAAYSDFIHQKEHPVVIMNLSIPAREIDVNIHPQKIEVKFSDEDKVFKFVRDTIKKSFEKVIVHQVPITQPAQKIFEPTVVYKTNEREYVEPIQIKDQRILEPIDFRIVGTVRGRYIIAESSDQLLIVDFHAAHERLIYEEMIESIEKMHSVSLLVNYEFDLKESEVDLLQSTELLKNIGFDYQLKGQKIIVTGIPKWLDQRDIKDFVVESIDEMKLIDIIGLSEVIKKVIANLACKSALRTRDKLDNDQAFFLVKKILEKKISTCPHGRPLIFAMKFTELDKFFERI